MCGVKEREREREWERETRREDVHQPTQHTHALSILSLSLSLSHSHYSLSHTYTTHLTLTTLSHTHTHTQENVRLCCMTTVRADFSVAVRSEVDGKMYFNLMVFLQMDCCDLATGQLKPDKRPWVHNNNNKNKNKNFVLVTKHTHTHTQHSHSLLLLSNKQTNNLIFHFFSFHSSLIPLCFFFFPSYLEVYWTERVGMVNGVQPQGLYNREVRERLYTYLQAMDIYWTKLT